jgi:hypothetical protein
MIMLDGFAESAKGIINLSELLMRPCEGRIYTQFQSHRMVGVQEKQLIQRLRCLTDTSSPVIDYCDFI